MFLTARQKEILEAQLPRKRSGMIPSERLGISESSINSTNTKIFEDFAEALELMADPDVFALMEGRFKKHAPRVWDYMRLIRLARAAICPG